MEPQRQAQLQKTSLLSLVTFSDPQTSSPQLKINPQALHLINKINSPIYPVTIVNLASTNEHASIISHLLKQQTNPISDGIVTLKNSIWMSAKINKINCQHQGEVNTLILGTSITGTKMDERKLKILSKLSACMLFIGTSDINKQKLKAIQDNQFKDVPSIWIRTQDLKGGFDAFLKQNSSNEIWEIIQRQINWKQIIEIKNKEQYLLHIMELVQSRTTFKYLFGNKLNGTLLTKYLQYQQEESQDNFKQYLKKSFKDHNQLKQFQRLLQSYKSGEVNMEDFLNEYRTIVSSCAEEIKQQLLGLIIQNILGMLDNVQGKTKLQKSLQEANLKIKDLQQKYVSTKKYVEILKRQSLQQINQIKQKHNQQIQQLKSDLSNELQKKLMGQKKINQTQNNIEQQIIQLKAINLKLEQRNSQLQKEIELIQETSKTQLLKYAQKVKVLQDRNITQQFRKNPQRQAENKDLYEEFQFYKDKSQKQIQSKQKCNQQLRSRIQELAKQLSMVQQKQQLSKIELSDFKEKYNEAKQSEARALDLLETKHEETSFIMAPNDQINNKLSLIQLTSKNYEITIKEMQAKLKLLQNQSSETELHLKRELQKSQDNVKRLQQQIKNFQVKLLESKNKYQAVLKQSEIKLQQSKKTYESKILELQSQLQDIKQNTEMNILQNKDRSQEDVMVIKSYYQQERLLKEKKYQDQKVKLEANHKNKVSELESRHQQEMDELIESRQEAINNLSQQQEHLGSIIKSLESDQIIKINQISNLKQKIRYITETTNKQIQQIQSESKQELSSLKQQIKHLSLKYEELKQTLMTKEGKLMSAQKQIQRNLEQYNQVYRKEREVSKQLESVKKQYEDFKQENKKKLSVYANQQCSNKIEIEKKSILNEQYTKYSESRILELQNLLALTRAESLKQLQELKNNLHSSSYSEIQNLRKENQVLTIKNEELMNVVKEKEIQILKKTLESQKQLSLSKDKIQRLQKSLQDQSNIHRKSNEDLQLKIVNLKQIQSKKQSQYKCQGEAWKQKLKQCETSKNTIQYQLQKSKILWEGKINHLQKHKKQEKEEHEQKVKKLMATIEILKNKQKSESLHETLAQLQIKYSEQIRQISQAKLKQQLKYQENIKLLSLELKTQKQKLIHLQNRAATPLAYQKNKTDKSYEQQIQKLKEQKDATILEYQKTHLAEKDLLRNKIKSLQEKVLEFQKTKSFYLFQQQKDKAKWNMERDHFKDTIKQLEQSLSSLKSAKQRTQKQNQNMKVQRKKFKNLNVSMSMNMKSSLLSSYNKWGDSDKIKGINVKDYSIFGSDSKTPDILSNSQDSITEQKSEDMVKTDD